MSNYIYQMCTFTYFVSGIFGVDYKFDAFYTSRKKTIEGVEGYVKYLCQKENIKSIPIEYKDSSGLNYVMFKIENESKTEYYGYRKHRVNI